MAENVDPKIINGKQIAEEIQEQLKGQVAEIKQSGITPCLSVILVGNRKDSETYVRMKKQAAEKIGKIKFCTIAKMIRNELHPQRTP